jgi:tetratricopeptide (TPR) repeat protein
LVSLVGAGDTGWPPLIDAFEAKIVEVVDGQVRFTHPLLGSVLYADTPVPVRQDLHRRLAELVHDPEESARHLALAVDGPSAEVASRLEGAARVARSRVAPSSAGGLLERSIVLTPPDDQSTLARRHLEAARCWEAAGDTARSIALLERAAAIAPPGSERADALTQLGRATAHGGDCRRAAVFFKRALEEPCDVARVRISLEMELTWNHHWLGELEAAEERAENAVALADALGERGVLVETLGNLGLVQMLRRREAYRESLDRALALEREVLQHHSIADEETLGYWWMTDWQNAMALAWAGELDASREFLDAISRDAAERGDEHALPFVVTWLSRIALWMDEWPEAAQYAEEGYEASVSAGGQRTYALVPLATVQAFYGDVEAARNTTDEGMRLADSVGMVSGRFEHQLVRGGLELSLGDVDAAYTFLAPLPRCSSATALRSRWSSASTRT